jgi:hypothetical protein
VTPTELNGYAPHFRKALESVRDQAAARARQEVLAEIGAAFVRQVMGGGVGNGVAVGDLFRKAAQHSPAGGVTIAGKHYPGGQFIPAEELAKASPAEKAELERKQGGGGEADTPKPDGASPKATPPKLDFSTPPKAELSPHANLAAVRSSLTGLFGVAGMDENLKKVSQVVGAPVGANVIVHFASAPSAPAPSVEVTIEHPLYTATRTVKMDDRGRRFVYNEEIRVNPESTGQGVGAAVFAAQVKQAAAHGFAYISCVAGGDGASSANTWRKAKGRFPQAKSLADVANYPGGKEWLANPRNKDMNGYYTWPRLGYDQSIRKPNGQPYYHLQEAAERFPEAKSVQDILSTPEGREWWKANGQELTDTRFDLTPGSRSMQILDAYLEEKAAAKSPTSAPTTKPPSTAPGPDSTPSGSVGSSLSPPEPGFTGTDRLGREWRDGKLMAKQEQPADAKKPAAPSGQYGHWGRAADGVDDAPRSKPLSREERAKRAAKAKQVVEKAIADPKSIRPHELRALHGHFLAMSKEEQKEYARRLREKVGGTKAELADRLRERIKAERTKKEGTRVSTQQVPTLGADADPSGYEVVGKPALSKEAALSMNAGADVVAVQKRGGKWVALRGKGEKGEVAFDPVTANRADAAAAHAAELERHRGVVAEEKAKLGNSPSPGEFDASRKRVAASQDRVTNAKQAVSAIDYATAIGKRTASPQPPTETPPGTADQATPVDAGKTGVADNPFQGDAAAAQRAGQQSSKTARDKYKSEIATVQPDGRKVPPAEKLGIPKFSEKNPDHVRALVGLADAIANRDPSINPGSDPLNIAVGRMSTIFGSDATDTALYIGRQKNINDLYGRVLGVLSDIGVKPPAGDTPPPTPPAAPPPAAPEPKAEPEKSPEPEKAPEPKGAGTLPAVKPGGAQNPNDPAYVAAGKAMMADDKFRKDVAAAYAHLKRFPEFSDGLVDLPSMYGELRSRRPDLTHDQFHAAMDHLSRERQAQLHALNEVASAPDAHKQGCIRRTDTLYHYVKLNSKNPDDLKPKGKPVQNPTTGVDEPTAVGGTAGVGVPPAAQEPAAAASRLKALTDAHVATAGTKTGEKNQWGEDVYHAPDTSDLDAALEALKGMPRKHVAEVAVHLSGYADDPKMAKWVRGLPTAKLHKLLYQRTVDRVGTKMRSYL